MLSLDFLRNLIPLGICLALSYFITTRVVESRRLRHIPGPRWTAWTNMWLMNRQLGGRVARELAEMHKTYGPIIRIAPNWVVISDPKELRKVWAARGPWYRGRWYELFRLDQPIETVLSQRDDTEHNWLRTKLLPGYTGKDVDDLHPNVDQRMLDFINLIERKYISTDDDYRPMDLAQKAQFLTLDVISTLAFGQCFGCLETDTDLYKHVLATNASIPVVVALSLIPDWLPLLANPVVRFFLPKAPLEGVKHTMDLATAAAEKRYGPNKIVKRDMLGSFVSHGLPLENAPVETFGQIGAGSDTTATAMRMTLLYLMTNPEAYQSLRTEVDEAVADGRITSSPISEAEARNLPYLQGVIREGLRVWPPVAGLMPKICDTDKVVCGKKIPAGTNVAWAAIAVLRDKAVFGEDAECFRPSRWVLETDKDKLRVMEQVCMLSFGTSSRWECLGKNIALLELNKVFVEVRFMFSFSTLLTFPVGKSPL